MIDNIETNERYVKLALIVWSGFAIAVSFITTLSILVKTIIDTVVTKHSYFTIAQSIALTSIALLIVWTASAFIVRILEVKRMYIQATISTYDDVLCPICRSAHIKSVTVSVFSARHIRQYECGTVVSNKYSLLGFGTPITHIARSLHAEVSDACKNLVQKDDII